MEKKKINNINEIWDGENLLITEFINLDLEGINLGEIPIDEWEKCYFCNTSFKNTNIKFIPKKLLRSESGYIIIDSCDFSNNDLSYLTDSDLRLAYFKSCDFRNTKLKAVIYKFKNLFLDETYPYENKKFINDIDIGTIINNSFISYSSKHLIRAIRGYLNERFTYNEFFISMIISISEEFLEYDKSGDLKKIYEYLKPMMNNNEKVEFFKNGIIADKNFENINIENFPIDLLNCFTFQNCIFKNINVDNDLLSLLRLNSYVLNESNEYNDISFSSINYDSWRQKYSNRISETSFTFRTNLYLELGRSCNAKCKFCRNQSYDNCKYCYDNILNTLKEVYPYIDSVVIGGGEPTTRKNDLSRLVNEHMPLHAGVDWYIFTNSSDLYFDADIYYNTKYNISRHAVKDKNNAKIFGLSESDLASTRDLENFIYEKESKNVTLCATCFKGGLDNELKIINYINFCEQIGCKNILISDLQKDMSLGKNISRIGSINIRKNVFPRVISFLEQIGFKKSLPIYATGGYTSTVLKKDGITIAFKHYISMKELELGWKTAYKRTFDLSIDPEGNLYENWHQKSESVKSIGKRK